MQLKIKVTKEHIEKAKYCSSDFPENCAIAIAVKDIFPRAYVAFNFFFVDQKLFRQWLHIKDEKKTQQFERDYGISLPAKARSFIHRFDYSTPTERSQLNELEFEVDIPDHIIEEHINIEEIKEILNGHPTLSLV